MVGLGASYIDVQNLNLPGTGIELMSNRRQTEMESTSIRRHSTSIQHRLDVESMSSQRRIDVDLTSIRHRFDVNSISIRRRINVDSMSVLGNLSFACRCSIKRCGRLRSQRACHKHSNSSFLSLNVCKLNPLQL